MPERMNSLPMWRNSGPRSLRAILALAGLLLWVGSAASALQCADDRVIIVTESGTRTFQVEIADTPETRARGLMFRRALPEGQGMLFVYERAQPMSFWMRNTPLPLDILFMDDRGLLRHIHPDARPFDETPIPGARPDDPAPERLMALEIGGGEARRLGLRVGQAIAHPRIEPSRALLPCRFGLSQPWRIR